MSVYDKPRFIDLDDYDKIGKTISASLIEEQAELLYNTPSGRVEWELTADDGAKRKVTVLVGNGSGRHKVEDAMQEIRKFSLNSVKWIYLELMGDVSLTELNQAANLILEFSKDEDEKWAQALYDEENTDRCTIVLAAEEISADR